MPHSGDNVVLYLLIGLAVYFMLRPWLSRISWSSLFKKPASRVPVRVKGEVPELLRKNGYDVISAKTKTELAIYVNGEKYESRVYIDYIAQAEGESYIVMVARDRKPIRMSGASLRDALLPYYLLYQPDGIIYVHKETGRIRVIDFEVPDVSLGKDWQSSGWTYFVFGVLLGMVVVWIWK